MLRVKSISKEQQLINETSPYGLAPDGSPAPIPGLDFGEEMTPEQEDKFFKWLDHMENIKKQSEEKKSNENLDSIVKKIEDGEDLSYQDLVDLQNNQDYVKKNYPDNPFVWEAAGLPEEDWNNKDLSESEPSVDKKESKTESPKGDWFDNLSDEAKTEYKKEHPNSKYAKGSKGLRLKVKASFSGSKTIKDTNQTLETIEKRLQVRFRDFRTDIKRNSGPNLRFDLRILLSDVKDLQKYLEALATDLDNNNISDK